MINDMSFTARWKATVSSRGSVVCAGLDPPPAEMGRGDKGLPADTDRRDWALRYLDAVAPYVSALKPNVQYWKGPGDIAVLEEVCAAARELGLLVVEDAKLADIGATNDAGFFYAARRADAVTLAPFGGNLEASTERAHERGIAVIPLCLMSNPEYASEKTTTAAADDLPRFEALAAEAARVAADGVVVGAPSPENHITEEELRAVRRHIGADLVVLMPGVGAQGGDPAGVFSVFDPDQVIVAAARGLMFPRGSGSTPAGQAEAARALRDQLEAARGGAGGRGSAGGRGDGPAGGRGSGTGPTPAREAPP
jgi:orotidine-5'-phosphate decarboxylase